MVTAVLLGAAACSQPISPAGPQEAPQVFLSPEEAAPDGTAQPDMDRPTAFVTDVYTEQWDDAATMVADNTVAARYIAHQTAAAQVDDLNGNSLNTDPDDVDVSNEGGAVTVDDSSQSKPAHYE